MFKELNVVNWRQVDAVSHLQSVKIFASLGNQIHGHVDAPVDQDGVTRHLGLDYLKVFFISVTYEILKFVLIFWTFENIFYESNRSK